MIGWKNAQSAMRALSDYLAVAVDADDLASASKLASAIPQLFVWGEEDRILPIEFGRQQWEASGTSIQFVAIANAAHMVHFERPGVFNQSVLSFLGSQSLATGLREQTQVNRVPFI